MKETIAIIGFGRLGETLASILLSTFTVRIIETSASKRELAEAQGYDCIALPEIRTCSTVFICVPIGAFEQTLKSLIPHLQPGMLVQDVCSVKVYPAQLMQDLLPSTIECIATHPLFGPDSVMQGYKNLAMVTHPLQVSQERYDQWNSFWQTAGFTVVQARPHEHDQATAYTLGMTHFFGRIMSELNLQPQAITTVSYNALLQVMTQTNRDSWELFRDMQRFNPYAKEMRDRVYAAIQTVERRLNEALDTPDR